MRALKIIAIVIAILLVVVIALPFFINVNTFRPTLESNLSTTLGREVKVGNLGLSILAGSVSAETISIADDPAFSKEPFVKAKSLQVGVELMPLIFSKSLHVTEITLDHPEITLLSTPAGKWNYSSLGSKSASTPASPSATPEISVRKLSVKDGTVTVGSANAPGKSKTYSNVNVTVSNLSLTSQFPFTVSADLPGGGSLSLDGQAGPVDQTDTSQTPLQAKIGVKKLNLAASGFVDPASGIAGIADFDGTLKSDGRQLNSDGTIHAEQLKLSPKGQATSKPVEVKYAITHDLQKQAGQISRGDISLGKALAQLTGRYQIQGETTNLNMKLNGQSMPVDELEAMLPALGVVLPSGSSLKGGTLSTALAITGTSANTIITGPIKLADTKLAGFNLGSKLSAISALTGANTGGADTAVQNFSTDARVSPSGIDTQNVNLTIPTLGVLTGSGTVSPSGALDYKMTASISGSAVTGLTQLAGLGNKGGSIPFFIRGTTSNPSFVPDVKGMLGNQLKLGIPGAGQSGQSPKDKVIDTFKGLFGRKKKQ
ncbi:MAG: AsmA family protein [Acidobacteria bacterium]|nr:AsmA family protein [Acidobacteriota bacterium]